MKKKVGNENLWNRMVVLTLLILLVAPALCYAQEFTRAGGEFFGTVRSLSGDKTSGSGVTLELDDTILYGVGIGANLNEYLNLNTSLLFGSTDIAANVDDEDVMGDTSLVAWEVNLDYNILKSRLTPMVTAGFGLMNFSGDFGGYSFSEADFSYNLGVGLRWDVTDSLMAKLFYGATWTKLEDTTSDIMMDGVNLSIGFAF